ncbi:MAG: tryptophan synthase subunit alpha [Gemmatimonadaceae bacterium]
MASGLATISSDVIDRRFAALGARGGRALVPYITAGYPNPTQCLTLLRGLESAGADLVEIGVPFSDPLADGPVIQASSQQALAAGMTFDRTLDLIHAAALAIPVVLFSYINPLIAAGPDALTRAAAAGAHGVLVTDLPVGADAVREQWLGGGPLAFVRLVAPTTPSGRMAEIARNGSGFVYLISRLGVTGAREQLPTELTSTVSRLRGVTSLPICVGFGISTPDQAATVARVADGVVVGSALVLAAGKGGPGAALSLVAGLRAAMDGIA